MAINGTCKAEGGAVLKKSVKRFLAGRGITKRWLINSLGVTLLILIIVETAFIVSIKNYYYSSARQVLD